MTLVRTCLCLTAALVLTSGDALSQEACSSYTVVPGDNLRRIAREAYGDGDRYRVIYGANAEKIGAGADLIVVGMVLNIPCDPDNPDQAGAVETAAAPEATEADPAPALKPIGFVTGNGYAPFADEMLPGGGMFTQLVEMAVFRADPAITYNLTFINDWEAHIEALLPSGAYDLSFPWQRPDCEAPETLSPGDRNRCDDFVFSAPFYEVVEGLFATRASGLAGATSYDDLMGKRICRPEAYTTGVLDNVGLTAPDIVLIRPASVIDCFRALRDSEVDLVSIDAEVGDSAIAALGLVATVEQNPHLATLTSLHVIAHKSNPRAVEMITRLDAGIVEMYQSGEWYDIVSTALAENSLQR